MLANTPPPLAPSPTIFVLFVLCPSLDEAQLQSAALHSLHIGSAAFQGPQGIILPSSSSHLSRATPEDLGEVTYCGPTSAVCRTGFLYKVIYIYIYIFQREQKQRHLCQVLRAEAKAQCLPVLPVAENMQKYLPRR